MARGLWRITPLLAKAIQDLNLKLEDLATTTPQTAWQEGSFVGRFFVGLKEKLAAWFADAANGIHDFYASAIHATTATFHQVTADQLCAGSVCVDQQQLAALLASAGESPAPASSPSDGGSSSVGTTPPTPAATTSPETSDAATPSINSGQATSPAVTESASP